MKEKTIRTFEDGTPLKKWHRVFGDHVQSFGLDREQARKAILLNPYLAKHKNDFEKCFEEFVIFHYPSKVDEEDHEFNICRYAEALNLFEEADKMRKEINDKRKYFRFEFIADNKERFGHGAYIKKCYETKEEGLAEFENFESQHKDCWCRYKVSKTNLTWL